LETCFQQGIGSVIDLTKILPATLNLKFTRGLSRNSNEALSHGADTAK